MQLIYHHSRSNDRSEPRIFDLRSPWADRLLLVLFALLVRLPGVPPSVMDWDESVYILTAREILQGRLPYVGLFDNKPLGGPSLIALALATLGHSVVAVRLLGFAAVAATSLLLHATALRAQLPRSAGLAAALLYAAFATQLDGLSTNTELLFAPFTVAALYIAVRHVKETSWRGQCAITASCGLLFGIGIWIKYVAALPAAALFAGLVGSWFWRRRTSLSGVAALAGVYGALCLLPTLLTAALYWSKGQIDIWWYCNFGYMAVYLALRTPLAETMHVVQANLLEIWPLLLLSGLALPMARGASPTVRAFVAAVVVWTLVEAAVVVAPQKFFDHYFLVLTSSFCCRRSACCPAWPWPRWRGG
jgi:Dolichyl-phosphate-mannose-protein mannosyltransferase